MKLIEPAPHEYAANLIYDEYDLDPYFAADSIVKQHGGSTGWVEFDYGSETWEARLRHQESNLLPPESPVLPSGTEFTIETIREFRLRIRRSPMEDGAVVEYGTEKPEQKFDAHIAPRWKGIKGEKDDGSETVIHYPHDELGECVNVRVQGSNIEFTEYVSLLERGAEAVGMPGYFERPHEFSNTQDIALYGRIHTDESGPVHARTGPIARMAHLLENDRSGRREIKQYDTDNHGRDLPGFNHAVILDQKRIREAWPHHDVPKEIKHYYAREALSKDRDDPLRHPKVEVAYQVSRWDGKVGVTDEELDELRDELTEAFHSILIESGLDVSPTQGTGIFETDAYFDAEIAEFEEPAGLNLADIEQEQEHIVVRHLARHGGFSPVEEESIRTLLADGGEVSPDDIAEENGRHPDSVRRALRRMDDVVEREYGKVALRSTHVASLVHEAIEEADKWIQRAQDAAGEALRAAEQGLDDKTSAFIAWAERYGIDWRDPNDARLQMRLGEVESSELAKRIIRIGWDRWTDARGDGSRYRAGTAQFRVDGTRRSWRISQLLHS